MRYVKEADKGRVRGVEDVGNIHRSGSVAGMQTRHPGAWERGGQVRIGAYVYNVGPAEVARLRSAGLLHGERG